MLTRALRGLFSTLTRFVVDNRASVTVDFVVSIPILIGVLVLTTEYGRVLQMRTVLDNAVADATRYLTRVQTEPGGNFSTSSIEIAQHIIRARINTKYLAISNPSLTNVGGIDTVQMSAAVGIVSPALSVLSIGGPGITLSDGTELKDVDGLIVTSTETFRYFGR